MTDKNYDINEETYQTIRKKMHELRKKHNLKVKDMADKGNLTLQHYSRIERGVSPPSIHALNRFSKEFNVHISYFFSDDKNVNIIDREGNILAEDLNVQDAANILAFRNVKDLSPEAKKQVEEFIKYIRYKEFTDGISEKEE